MTKHSDPTDESINIYRQIIPVGAEFENELFQVIDENDPARDYVRRISKIEDTTAEIEGRLARLGRGAKASKSGSDAPESSNANDDLNHIEELVGANLRLSVWVARNFANRGLPMMDLIEAGNIGLRQAAEKYDTERGYQFPIYAMWFIRQNITRAVANQLRRGANPLDLQIQRTREYDDRTVFADHESFDASESKASSGRRNPKDLNNPNSSNNSGSPNNQKSQRSSSKPGVSREDVIRVMYELPARERDVLRLRFGLDDGCERSLEEIGEIYGMTSERVRQIELRALRKIQPAHRLRNSHTAKRTPVKRIGRGQFLAVLAELPEHEAEIMRFKWGFFDSQIRSVAETAEKFSLSLEEVELLEAKALNMVSDL